MPTHAPTDSPVVDHFGPDLEDPDRFVLYPKVPILDVHSHKTKGDVTEDTLRLLAVNGNTRARGGHYSMLIPGHTRDGVPEERQPDRWGFSKNFVVGRFDEKPCLFADFYIDKDKIESAKSMNFRSVERWSGPDPEDHVIDHIALLKTSPQRPLGLMTYSRPDGLSPGATLVRYARNLPALSSLSPSLGCDSSSPTPPGPAGEAVPSPTVTENAMALTPEEIHTIASAVASAVTKSLIDHLEKPQDDPAGDDDGDGIPNADDPTPEGTAEPAAPARMGRQNQPVRGVAQPAGRQTAGQPTDPGTYQPGTYRNTGRRPVGGQTAGPVVDGEGNVNLTATLARYQKANQQTQAQLEAEQRARQELETRLQTTAEEVGVLTKLNRYNARHSKLADLVANEGYLFDPEKEIARTIDMDDADFEAEFGRIKTNYARGLVGEGPIRMGAGIGGGNTKKRELRADEYGKLQRFMDEKKITNHTQAVIEYLAANPT